MTKRNNRAQDSASDPVGELGAYTIGLILGAIIGGGVALWFAPRSGKQTRHDIRNQAEQTVSQVRERVDGPSTERLMADGRTAARTYRETAIG